MWIKAPFSDVPDNIFFFFLNTSEWKVKKTKTKQENKNNNKILHTICAQIPAYT